MKALLIGGTGTISAAISRLLIQQGWDLYLMNRGGRPQAVPEGAHVIVCDIGDEQAAAKAVEGMYFDVVGEFIGFVPSQVERDIRLFEGKCGQYIYISSASAYHKPLRDFLITEGTTLANPYWEYSRNKIACEEVLMRAYRERAFPVTIVRPSHTYDERSVPIGVHGQMGSWQVIKRIMEDKPVLIQGDGTSLWTLTFNTDFAKGYVGLMANPHAIGEAFHITSDETLTWNQIYETVAKLLHKKLRPYYVSSAFLDAVGPYDFKGSLTGDKACSVRFDNSKLKHAVPGYKATVRFEQGAAIALKTIMAYPEYQKEEPEFGAWCDKVIETLEKAKEDLALRFPKV